MPANFPPSPRQRLRSFGRFARVFLGLAALLASARADSIATALNSGQLQIWLGTSEGNSAVATTTDQANDIFVGGSGMGNTIFGPVTSISVTFQGSGQLFALENNPLPFSASLTSPILINSTGFGLSNEVLDDTTTGGNAFDFSGFTDPVGRLTSEGNPGTAPLTILSSKGANFVLSDAALVTGASTVELLNVRTAILTHTAGFHEFNSAGWTGNLSLTNNAGATLTITNALDYANVTNLGALVFDYSGIAITNVGGTGLAGANPNFGPAGAGGAALTFAAAGNLTTVAAKSITGGLGGTPAIEGDGGTGGDGVVFSATGSLVNAAGATISGGQGGAALANGLGGSGGRGVVFQAAGTLVNAAGATINGGLGGENAISGGGTGPTGVAAAFLGGAGNLTNAGTINGDVTMGSFANAVTLLAGGVINGDLSVGGNASSTLTLGGAGNQSLSTAVTGNLIFNGSLIKQGTGTWTLDDILGYSGATTLAAGTLRLFSPGVLGDGDLRFTGGTLQYGAGTTADLSAKFSAAASQLYSVDTNGNNVTFATALTSSGGSLTKLGLGTLTLSAANTYSAGTTLAGGILQAANSDALGTGPVTFAGGTLQYGAGVSQDFSGQFSTAAGQRYAIDTNGNTVTFASSLTSSGATLNKLGAGSLVLTGFAPLTGSTTVSGGNLQLGTVVGSFNTVTLIGSNGTTGSDTGGPGGAGVIVAPGATLNLVNGSITGGAGGFGPNQGGNGGVGVSFFGAADFVNPAEGTIQGGAAVAGFALGGNAVVFKAGGSLTNQDGGQITGGATPEGYGGTGVVFEAGGSLTNESGGQITGGSTPEGYGGSGVVFTGGPGTLVNAGTITGGNNNQPGYNGTGVLFTATAGNLTNSGTINGGVTMATVANAVTLLSGGVINGDLSIGGNTSSTLTLTGSGDQAYSGAVTGATTFAGSLVKQGSGKWTLDQAFNFGGGTTLQSGILEAANAAAFGSGAIRFTGGTLRYAAGLTTDFSPQFSPVASQSFLIDTNGNAVTFGTALTSSGGSLTKLGTGSLTLTGNNSFGGATLSAGQLQIGTPASPGRVTGAASTGPGGTAGTGVATAAGTTLNLNGTIAGGLGWSSSEGTSNGGTGVSLGGNATFAPTAGASLLGGAGGNGGDLANGGAGGAGVILGGGATFTGAANMTVTGGAGGSSGTLAITTGGQGGAGILVGSGATFVNATGAQISGGAGGASDFTGGNGGEGIRFLGNATFTNPSAATIQGGAATDGFANGGAGVVFEAGGSLTNQSGALIAGGATPFGTGGTGVAFLAGGALTNAAGATISGGSGAGVGGGNGTGVSFAGGNGSLTNAGTIQGGVAMGNAPNAVTLLAGGVIDGDLNVGPNAGSTLTLAGFGNQTYSAAVTGATTFNGSLVKAGNGTWTLDQALAPGGGTTINAGTLSVTGNLSGGTVTVNAGGTLGGTGPVGAISLAGGTLSPGVTAGTLTTAGLLWTGGGILFDLGPTPATSDLIQTGALQGGGTSYAFTFVDQGWVFGAAYDLITFSSSDIALGNFTFTNAGGFDGHFGYQGNTLQFTVTGVPEPGTWAILVLCAAALLAHRLRRQPTRR